MLKNNVAIVIPIYKNHLNDDEWISLKNNIKKMESRAIFLIIPFNLEKWIKENVQKVFKNLNVKCYPNKYFSSVSSYNKLLMSKSFYKSFERYEYMLICQLDALILEDKLDYWCGKGYSYVGAPWFIGFSNPLYPLEFYGVGNGGFSLRKVKDYINFFSKFRKVQNIAIDSYKVDGLKNKIKYLFHKYIFIYNNNPLQPRINEDIFWGVLVPHSCKYFKVPEPIEALDFAFEVKPEIAYEINGNQLPFGCHAWEKYNKKFWMDKLSELKNE